jgi:hypothetical protein
MAVGGRESQPSGTQVFPCRGRRHTLPVAILVNLDYRLDGWAVHCMNGSTRVCQWVRVRGDQATLFPNPIFAVIEIYEILWIGLRPTIT